MAKAPGVVCCVSGAGKQQRSKAAKQEHRDRRDLTEGAEEGRKSAKRQSRKAGKQQSRKEAKQEHRDRRGLTEGTEEGRKSAKQESRKAAEQESRNTETAEVSQRARRKAAGHSRGREARGSGSTLRDLRAPLPSRSSLSRSRPSNSSLCPSSVLCALCGPSRADTPRPASAFQAPSNLRDLRVFAFKVLRVQVFRVLALLILLCALLRPFVLSVYPLCALAQRSLRPRRCGWPKFTSRNRAT